jgi:hypothetical protein
MRRTQKPAFPSRPHLECLEDRVVPSASFSSSSSSFFFIVPNTPTGLVTELLPGTVNNSINSLNSQVSQLQTDRQTILKDSANGPAPNSDYTAAKGVLSNIQSTNSSVQNMVKGEMAFVLFAAFDGLLSGPSDDLIAVLTLGQLSNQAKAAANDLNAANAVANTTPPNPSIAQFS